MNEPQRRVDPDHPWPALLAFTENDQQFFGGRKEEAEALFRRIVSSRLTLLFGISGIGKSSLLRAGLFPRLRGEHYFPVYIRLRFGKDLPSPLEQIKSEITAQAHDSHIEAPPPDPDEPLWQYFDRAEFWDARNYPCVPVLVFDQFEELFTKSREVPRQANELIEELADLAEGVARTEHRYRLLIGIRADYLARLQAISDRVRAVFANRYELHRMNGAAALESTLTAGGHLVDDDVARRIVRFVAGAAEGDAQSVEGLEVEPALLSLVCSELNATRIANGESRITASMLSGTKDEILSRFYEASFEGVAPELRALVEDKLVTRDGKARNFISEQTARETPGVTEDDLAKLVHRRLLRFEESGASRRMELTHDLLTTVAAASRSTREQRRQLEEAERARVAAEQREASARRALRRSRAALLVFFVLLAAAVAGPFIAARWTATGAKRVEADSAFRLALQQLSSDEPSLGLAYLAHVIRLDRGNSAARTLLYEQLVSRSWPVPTRAFGPPGRIAEAVFSNDGASVVFRVGETIEMWDVAKGTFLGRVEDVAAQQQIKFAAEGSTVLDAGGLAVWNPRTGRKMTRLDICRLVGVGEKDCSPRIFDVSVKDEVALADSASGLVIASLSGDRPVERIPLIRGHARFGPDPRFVAIDDETGNATVVDREAPLRGESDRSKVLGGVLFHFSRDGKRILLAPEWKTDIEPWDVERWTSAGKRFDNQSSPRTAIFDPSGQRILTTADDDGIRLWNAAAGTPIIAPLRHPGLRTAGFSPDGARIVTASDQQARWWNAITGGALSAPIVEPKILAAHADNRGNVVTVSPAAARVWEVANSVLPPVAESRLREPRQLSADRTKVRLEAGSEWEVVDAATGKPLWKSPAGAHVTAVDPQFSRAVVRDGETLQLVDTASWKVLWTLPPEMAYAGFSADSTALIYNHGLTAVSVATRKLLAPPTIRPDFLDTADESRDGLRLAVRFEKTIEVWDIPQRRAVLTLPAASDVKVDLSDDGRQLAAVSPREGLRVWDVATGQVRTAKHEEELTAVTFSPDGGRLAAIAENGVVLCDAQTLDCSGELIVHPDVESVELSADGKRLMTTGGNNLRIWDVATRRPLMLALPRGSTHPSGLSPDGRFVISTLFGEAYRLPVPSVNDDDAEGLAAVAEALAGVRVDRLGVTEQIDGMKALADLGKTCRGIDSLACNLVRWFQTPSVNRTVSPASNVRVADYVKSVKHFSVMWWLMKARFHNEPSLGGPPPPLPGFD